MPPSPVRDDRLEARRYTAAREASHCWDCRDCQDRLELHQPDPDLPDRLLATCPGCGNWSLVEPIGAGDQVAFLQLPRRLEALGPADVP